MNLLTPRTTATRCIANIDPKLHTFVNDGTSGAQTEITYDAHSHSYAQSGWVKAAIEVDTPFASGRVSASYSSSHNESSSSKKLYMTGRYDFCAGTIRIPPSRITIAPEFKEAVAKALLVEPPSNRTHALTVVFEDYGHAYVDCVQVGATQIMEKTVEDDNTVCVSCHFAGVLVS